MVIYMYAVIIPDLKIFIFKIVECKKVRVSLNIEYTLKFLNTDKDIMLAFFQNIIHCIFNINESISICYL